MKKAMIHVTDPKIPAVVPGDGIQLAAGHAKYGNKPAVLKVGNPAKRGDPNSPAIILKKRLHPARQSTIGYLADRPGRLGRRRPCTSAAVNRNLPFLPSVQATTGANPHAAIPGREDGPRFIRQSFLD